MEDELSQSELMYAHKPDNALVKLCRDGNDDAFYEIVERYKLPVFNIVYRMLSKYSEAEDIAQTVFWKVYKNLYRFDTARKFSSWIFKITTNTCLDSLRKKRPKTIPLDEAMDANDMTQLPEAVLREKEETALVLRALNKLKPGYKIVIVLYHFENQTYKEISEILDIPLGTVMNRLHRARKQIKELTERPE